MWTLILFLHVLGAIFFVGGQLLLVVAVAPILRRRDDADTMRAVARDFGRGGAIAVALLVGTGVALAQHDSLWSSTTLQAKLGVVGLVGVLTLFHIRRPTSRTASWLLTLSSIVVVWLGVRLVNG
jgi:uncharacterized membrane protein